MRIAEKGTPGLDTWPTTIKTLRLIMSEIERNNWREKNGFWLQPSIEGADPAASARCGSGTLCLIGLARQRRHYLGQHWSRGNPT
jgi:hypothetical protein